MKPDDTGAPLPPPRRGQTRRSMRAAHMCSWPTRTCQVSLPHLTGSSESTFPRGLQQPSSPGRAAKTNTGGPQAGRHVHLRLSPANAKSATSPEEVEICYAALSVGMM